MDAVIKRCLTEQFQKRWPLSSRRAFVERRHCGMSCLDLLQDLLRNGATRSEQENKRGSIDTQRTQIKRTRAKQKYLKSKSQEPSRSRWNSVWVQYLYCSDQCCSKVMYSVNWVTLWVKPSDFDLVYSSRERILLQVLLYSMSDHTVFSRKTIHLIPELTVARLPFYHSLSSRVDLTMARTLTGLENF